MGEASIKVDRDGAHKRVIELREEIVRKRENIESQLEELRRRRANAVHLADKSARLAGAGILGLFVVSSLVGAVRDCFRSDEEVQKENTRKDTAKIQQEKKTFASVFASAVASILIAQARRYAIEYARKQISAPRVGTTAEPNRSANRSRI